MDAKFWDERYRAYDSVYGAAPNAFLKDELVKMKPGRALFPAEGEGRNALFTASLGWKVRAFDQSSVARDKALATAKRAGLELDYIVLSSEHFPEVDFPEGYDLIGLFYAHMPSSVRKGFHAKLLKNLAPYGRLLLECFSPRQLEFSSGGPKDADLLYPVGQALEDFSSLSDLHVSEMLVELDEGPFHQGTASVIRVNGVRS